jgi:hypothetical protein
VIGFSFHPDSIRSGRVFQFPVLDTSDHRVTRGWEAHLLCLFRLASQIASAGALSTSTPRVVFRFFTDNGALSHSDFLTFDEPQMIAAFHAWSESHETEGDLGKLRELSSAFLQRRKLFHSNETPGQEPVATSFGQIIELVKNGARDGIDYHHDDAKFKGYKDFGSSVVHEGTDENPQENGSEGIFLSDGNPASRSIPVEKDSHAVITPALIDHGIVHLNRVFVRSS